MSCARPDTTADSYPCKSQVVSYNVYDTICIQQLVACKGVSMLLCHTMFISIGSQCQQLQALKGFAFCAFKQLSNSVAQNANP